MSRRPILSLICANLLFASIGLAEPSSSREAWDVFTIGGSRVGYGHTAWSHVEDDGRQLIRWSSTNHVTLKRFGQTITQTLKLASLETTEGELLRFRGELSQGLLPVVTDGTVHDKQIMLETTTAGKRQSTELPWDPAWLGFAAADQLLVREPMRPGETRKYKTLMPVFNQVAEVQLDAVDYEVTDLMAGSHELLRIQSTAKLGKVNLESVMWVDRAGQTLKTFVPALEQYGYRSTRELALEKTEDIEFDLGQFSTVRLDRRIPNPHQTKQVVYRVQLKEGDPSDIFVTGLSQSVTEIDTHSARVTVTSVRPDTPPEIDPDTTQQPTPGDLEANSLIQSDNELIVRMAHGVTADDNPWEVARSLERYVRDQVEVKDFSQAFATAAEVAGTLEGDCTEHAVLLAALCRARDIPARVAMGLVYYAQESGLAYHMWNEVWIDDRWVPMDATLGIGGIGAAHLKLGDSNLKGATAYAAFLPVIQVLGRLSVEIESAK